VVICEEGKEEYPYYIKKKSEVLKLEWENELSAAVAAGDEVKTEELTRSALDASGRLGSISCPRSYLLLRRSTR
jgi:hypothetical protein